SDITCSNCGRKYHCKHKCFAKGGDREGQGPRQTSGNSKSKTKDGSNQAEDNPSDATNKDLADQAYTTEIADPKCHAAINSFKHSDWIADSGITSHVCNS
ncbi:hypothetical protein FB451DRAFT_989728, partial [Mycena latifolia]